MDANLTLSTDWNQAQLTHYRIHLALMACKSAKYSKKYADWYDGLMDLFSELSSSMDEKEQGEYKNKLLRLKEISTTKLQTIQLKSFLEYELTLRTLMRDRGLDLPRKHDPKRSLMS
jgi:hypothetical protein